MTEPEIKRWYIVTLDNGTEHLWMYDGKHWGAPAYFVNSEYHESLKDTKIESYVLTNRDNPIRFTIVK